MKITISIPTSSPHFPKGSTEAFTNLELTLQENALLDEIIHAFRTALYAATYHPDIINERIPTEDGL